MEPSISVVITCFNYGKYVTDAVGSVLKSTYTNYDIIIVDDGSTDPTTIEILRGLAESDKVRVIRRKNGGLSAARNTGISATKADYILPLDADDLIDPTFIEKGVWYLERNRHKISFVYSLVQLFGNQSKIWETRPFNWKYLKFRNYIPATILMRRSCWEAVGGYNECMRGGYEDWEFLIRLCKHGLLGSRLKEVLFFYRKHSGSMLEASKKNHKNLIREIREMHPDVYRWWMVQLIAISYTEFQWRVVRFFRWSVQSARNYVPSQVRKLVIRGLMSLKLPRPKAPFVQDRSSELDEPPVPPRIMILLPWLKTGGVETVFYQLVKHLAGRFDIILVTTKDMILQRTHYDFYRYCKEVFHIGSFVKTDAERLSFLLYLILSRRIQLVHISNSQFGYRCLPELRKHFPYVKTMDTLHMEEPWSAWDYFSYSAVYSKYLDTRVTLTSFLASRLHGTGHSCVEIISNGVLPADRKPNRDINSDNHQFTVAFVGRLVNQKQPLLFVRMAEVCHSLGFKFKFLIVGDGDLKHKVQAKVRRSSLSEYMEIRSFTDDVYGILSGVDVLCVPSLREGLPMIGLEAMNVGVPIVATDVPGWRDLIQHEVTGLLCESKPVELAKACIRLFQDASLYERISRHSRNEVEQTYNINNMVAGYSRIYSRLIAGYTGEFL